MKNTSSRRDFLAAAGLALPTAALASVGFEQAPKPSAPSSGGFSYRVLGKTGLKVTSVGFGCMITSDQNKFALHGDVERMIK
jgi:hypothetical protein